MTDDETQRVYAEKALDYEKLQPDAPFPSLRAFIARLPEGAEVLDLGCGPGHDSQHMARAVSSYGAYAVLSGRSNQFFKMTTESSRQQPSVEFRISIER